MSISQPPFSYTLGDRHSEQNLAGALRGAYIRLGTYSILYLNTLCLDSIWQIACVLCVPVQALQEYGYPARPRPVLDFGLWRVRFPPVLVRTARRLPVEALG